MEDERTGTLGSVSDDFPCGPDGATVVEDVSFAMPVSGGLAAEKFEVADKVGELKLEPISGLTVDEAESVVKLVCHTDFLVDETILASLVGHTVSVRNGGFEVSIGRDVLCD